MIDLDLTTASPELNTLLNQTANALTRLDERVTHLGNLTTPITAAAAALEAAHSAHLAHIHYAAHPVATSLIADDHGGPHPVARLSRALTAAHHLPEDTAATQLSALNTTLATSPVHAGRTRLHPDDTRRRHPGPDPHHIHEHLDDLDTFLTTHLQPQPLPATALAVAAADHITPFSHASPTTARAWATTLLHRAHLTRTIPAPLACGLTPHDTEHIHTALHDGDHAHITAHTAHALLRGAAHMAAFINQLISEADRMRDQLHHAKVRCNSLTWAATDDLLGHPVTKATHTGTVVGSDRFGGYTTINKLTDIGILQPGKDTYYAPRILEIWNAYMTPTPTE